MPAPVPELSAALAPVMDKVAVFATGPEVATMVTTLTIGEIAAVALNVAAVAPAVTTTEPGTDTELRTLLHKLITMPPGGAAPLSETVQLAEPPRAMAAGEQSSAERTAGATESDVDMVADQRPAVMVTDAPTADAGAVAVN
jgi:hypothetical protein